MSEELLMKAMQLKQQSEEIERQLNFVNEQIMELGRFSEGLKFMDEDKAEKGMLAGVGRGVYVKASRKKDEKLFVEVGVGVLVRKTPEETRAVIDGQIRKFNEARIQLKEQLEGYAAEFGKMINEIEELKGKPKS